MKYVPLFFDKVLISHCLPLLIWIPFFYYVQVFQGRKCEQLWSAARFDRSTADRRAAHTDLPLSDHQ